MNKTLDSRGFTILHILLVILVIAVLCFAGWRVWQAQNTDKAVPTSTNTERHDATSNEEVTTSYTPDFGGFTITYPISWQLAQDETIGGQNTTAQTLTSPSGTVLYIRADEGGKGGGCEPASGDVPFAPSNTCPSWEYLSKDPTSITGAFNMSLGGDIYEQALNIVTAHYSDKADHRYLIGLDDNQPDFPITLNNPSMGFAIPEIFFVAFDAKGENLRYIKVYASGETAEFLDSKDAQTIKTILRSLVITN